MKKSKKGRRSKVARVQTVERFRTIDPRPALFELARTSDDINHLDVARKLLNAVRRQVGQLKGMIPAEQFMSMLEADVTPRRERGRSVAERRERYYQMLVTLRRLIAVVNKRRVALLERADQLSLALRFGDDERPGVGEDRLFNAASVLRKAVSACNRTDEALTRAGLMANNDATNGKGEKALLATFKRICEAPETAVMDGSEIPIPLMVIPGMGYEFQLNAGEYERLEEIVSEVVPVLGRAWLAVEQIQGHSPLNQMLSQAFTDGEPSDEEKVRYHRLRDVLEGYLLWYKVNADRLLHAIGSASFDWRAYGRDPKYLWAVNVIVGATQIHRTMLRTRDGAMKALFSGDGAPSLIELCRDAVAECVTYKHGEIERLDVRMRRGCFV